jgi:prevent-host-death family protein
VVTIVLEVPPVAVRVNIREFKTHLSAYLRRVKMGEVVEIAERGTPIGRLIPADVPVEARMEMLARLGILVLGQGTLIPHAPAARARGGRTVADLLVEDRG